jgi:integrase
LSYGEKLRPPTTLTDREVAKLLKTMGQQKAGLRDRLIVSFGLGSALRESEIVALDVVDVANATKDGLEPKRIIQLRTFKRAGNGEGLNPKFQRVHVADETVHLLRRYLNVMWGDQNISTSMDRPLFPTRQSGRITDRQVRRMFRGWQQRAGFDHLYNFHVLRHTAVTNIVRESGGNIRLAQIQARHVSIHTTMRYEHASDEEVARAIKGLTA